MTLCMNPLGTADVEVAVGDVGHELGEAALVEPGVRARPDELVELPAALAHQVGQLVAQDQVAAAGAAQDRDHVHVAAAGPRAAPGRA